MLSRRRVPISNRYARGLALLSISALISTLFPVSAGGASIIYPRAARNFAKSGGGFVQLNTRGYLDDDCLQSDAPCLTQHFDKLKPEATAQAKVVRQLEFMHGKIFTPATNVQTDWVQWEVGPASNAWRMDVVVENPNVSPAFGIIEVKAWQGGGDVLVGGVDDQLEGYIVKARGVGITARRNNELNVAKWSKAYLDDVGNVMCVWADPDALAHPGNVYFSHASDTSITSGVGCKGATPEMVTARRNDEQKAQENANLVLPKPAFLPTVEVTGTDNKGEWHVSAPRNNSAPRSVKTCFGDGVCETTVVATGVGVAYFYLSHVFTGGGSFTLRTTILETGTFAEATASTPVC